MNPNVNYGLQAIMMFQCWFMDCNKCTTLVGTLMIGEATYVRGEEVYGNSVYPLPNFTVHLKLSLKKKRLLKKREGDE